MRLREELPMLHDITQSPADPNNFPQSTLKRDNDNLIFAQTPNIDDLEVRELDEVTESLLNSAVKQVNTAQFNRD